MIKIRVVDARIDSSRVMYAWPQPSRNRMINHAGQPRRQRLYAFAE